MQKKINTTDLHVRFRIETGEYHAYDTEHGGFHKHSQYRKTYQHWLEEQLVNSLNEKVDKENLQESFEQAIADLEDENQSLHDDVDYLENCIEN